MASRFKVSKGELYPMENREVSWLQFNARVLQEAEDKRNPLLERIRFLGIFSNNQDEFFRVRVGTLRRLQKLSKANTAVADKTKALIKRIADITSGYQKKFNEIYAAVIEELATHNIFILNEHTLDEQQKSFVRDYFREEIRPLIFPIMLKRFNSNASLRDKSIYLAIKMIDDKEVLQTEHALIKIPETHSRFINLPSEHEKHYIILIDDAIRLCLDEIFSFLNYTRFNAYTIKFTRDAELEIDNDISKSFLELMEESLKQRRKGSTLRFIYDQEIPESLLNTVKKKMELSDSDVQLQGGRYHNFKDFMDFPNPGISELSNPPMPPLNHPLLPYGKSVLKAVEERDILIHFPYHTFRHITDLLREASIDPFVRSIKMTIYRAAPKSKVINALINAARNGKSVTVYMELQARFDEKANISWANRLQEEGVEIIRTIPGFKVHAKLILVKRKEGKKETIYSNISTGNFNEITSEIYSDTSLLTSDIAIGREINQVFNLFEANYQQFTFKKILVSPFNTRSTLLRHLLQEIKSAKLGKEAWVVIKVNNLVDEAIVQKLYEAARAGVKLKLIVRGICVMSPQSAEDKANIEIISIVDKYLEHSRIFVFCHGGDPIYYLSSADLMTRNFDHRIEVTVPVMCPNLKKELWDFLQIQMKDNVKARVIDSAKMNSYRTDKKVETRSQIEHYKYFANLQY